MDVILLENVTNLGVLGDKVSVKRGYGRNYLMPQGKAVPATADRIAEFESRRTELEKKAKDLLAAAEKRMAALSEISATIEQKAGDEGKLFGSIGTQQIADAVTAAGAELLKAEVRLPDGAIRHIGEFDIAVQLHSDVTGTVKVIVAAE